MRKNQKKIVLGKSKHKYQYEVSDGVTQHQIRLIYDDEIHESVFPDRLCEFIVFGSLSIN